MTCKIQWIQRSKEEWDSLVNRCPHSTLLQTYYYAQTMREVSQQSSRHGIILIDGQEAGIVQMQEVSLVKGLIHGLSIDRGPLWFEDFGKPSHINAFAATLNWKFPKRWGRKRRFLPEVYDKKQLILLNNWDKLTKKPKYQTFIVNLSHDIDQIRDNFKKNWRSSLKKSEDNGFIIEKDDNLTSLSKLLKHYIKDRLEKGYAGASSKFLASLSKHAALNGECFILNAIRNGETLGSVLIFTHGQGATYQVGWVNTLGRARGANHLLLWEAIKVLKDRGITHFDLGGYNEETDGIRKFKEGLGGHAIALIGSYS